MVAPQLQKRAIEDDVPMLPMLVEMAAKEVQCKNNNGKMGGVSWLMSQMKDLMDSIGVHEGITCMFHIGRFLRASAFSRLWSTICVAEFITKFMGHEKQPVGVDYPFACFLLLQVHLTISLVCTNRPIIGGRG